LSRGRPRPCRRPATPKPRRSPQPRSGHNSFGHDVHGSVHVGSLSRIPSGYQEENSDGHREAGRRRGGLAPPGRQDEEVRFRSAARVRDLVRRRSSGSRQRVAPTSGTRRRESRSTTSP
jgi:hypothetical protein